MSKTIAQLNEVASLIKEATLKGENTADRVGGLFVDIVDYLGTIGSNEVVLSPLLKALNNSNLLNPSDGNILTFSMLKDGWTFSDAIAQLKITTKSIETTVASNYSAFSKALSILESDVAATDARVRSYKTDYDNSQLEYATWKSQTDTSISQYAVAIDKNTNQIVSISGRVDTAFDQIDFVTNNQEAADKALGKLFNLTGLDYEDPDEAYTASWLYKNRQGIYGAAATFDEAGNILQASKLQVTVAGIESSVESVDGRVSSLKLTVDGLTSTVSSMDGRFTSITQTVDTIRTEVNGLNGEVSTIDQKVDSITLEVRDNTGKIGTLDVKADEISARVTDLNGKYGDLKVDVNSISATVNDPTKGIGALNVRADAVEQKVTTLDGRTANMGVYVTKNSLEQDITTAQVHADVLNFKFRDIWEVYNSNDERVMWLDSDGNLNVTGKLNGDISGSIGTGNSSDNLRIYLENTSTGGRLVGKQGGTTKMIFGFNSAYPYLVLFHDLAQVQSDGSKIEVISENDFIRMYSWGNSTGLTITHDGTEKFHTYIGSGNVIRMGGNWPRSESAVTTGEIFVDGSGNVKVSL